MKILVTGGLGFIGSTFIRTLLKTPDIEIANVDCITYAANINLKKKFERAGVRNYKLDIQSEKIMDVFQDFQPDKIINFAAESHVDRSISNPDTFIQTNILGTYNLLNCALEHWREKDLSEKENFLYLHISTDEIYGSLKPNAPRSLETDFINPSSPYSASKASSDCLVNGWHITYGLPTIITNCTNNYGPYQANEKFIPTILINALNNKKIPIYGNGKQIRDWLFVEDHVAALLKIISDGRIGEKYNIGANVELTNIELVEIILNLLSKKTGVPFLHYKKLIEFVDDRLGHDTRYSLDTSKIKKEISWKPQIDLEEGLNKTIDWFLREKG